MDYGLWYPKGKGFTLTAYTDADWAGSIDDRKSTSGGAFFLEVAWLLGIVKSKSLFLYQLQRPSTLQLFQVAHRYCG